jgi:hypothetical protein
VKVLPPWPEHPLCGGCHREATTSRFEASKRRTEIQHADGAPACFVEGGNPFKSIDGWTVTFPIKTLPEFDTWPAAESWAAFVVTREDAPVYLGYVRSPDGHRRIGRVESEELAIAVAERQEDNTTLVRKPKPKP